MQIYAYKNKMNGLERKEKVFLVEKTHSNNAT